MCGPGQPRNWNDDVHAVNKQAVGTPHLQSPMLRFYCSTVLLFYCQVYVRAWDVAPTVFSAICKKDYKLGKYGK